MIKMQYSYSLIFAIIMCNALHANNENLKASLKKINSNNPNLTHSDDQMDSQRIEFVVKNNTIKQQSSIEWKYFLIILSGLFLFFRINFRFIKLKFKKDLNSSLDKVYKSKIKYKKHKIIKPKLTF